MNQMISPSIVSITFRFAHNLRSTILAILVRKTTTRTSRRKVDILCKKDTE